MHTRARLTYFGPLYKFLYTRHSQTPSTKHDKCHSYTSFFIIKNNPAYN